MASAERDEIVILLRMIIVEMRVLIVQVTNTLHNNNIALIALLEDA